MKITNEQLQYVRLIDVVFIAPYLIILSQKTKNRLDRNILLLLGVSTLIFNGYNYLTNDK